MPIVYQNLNTKEIPFINKYTVFKYKNNNLYIVFNTKPMYTMQKFRVQCRTY